MNPRRNTAMTRFECTHTAGCKSKDHYFDCPLSKYYACIQAAGCSSQMHYLICPHHELADTRHMLIQVSRKIPNGGYVGDLQAMADDPQVLEQFKVHVDALVRVASAQARS